MISLLFSFQGLILSPTMELALQTVECVRMMGKYCTDITIRSAVKGDMGKRYLYVKYSGHSNRPIEKIKLGYT